MPVDTELTTHARTRVARRRVLETAAQAEMMRNTAARLADVLLGGCHFDEWRDTFGRGGRLTILSRPVSPFRRTTSYGARNQSRRPSGCEYRPSSTTIARHLLTIRKAHRPVGYDDPTVQRAVKLTVAGLRRERGVASTPKTAFERDLLTTALIALDAQQAGSCPKARCTSLSPSAGWAVSR
jgi:hypothetical protein